ncbi:Glutathione S-transferase-like protein tpcF [Lachnellula suecica]|uniref:glutathione transferase n=1 Tax=Lachnellula suecica TaxID=602035 RepID=A0A8T9CE26_9HELO|nr:Glutathione S-transferase-like protein tpcF [Lachnellula suecica]
MSKPITLYSHGTGPNPWKVDLILRELNIPYETEWMDFADLKKEPFESKVSPNGRVPAIHDPNTNITLWESGAIIEYLVATYDKSAALTYTSSPEKYHVSQWLHFQMSGQGPYFGQAAWFWKFHQEQLPSAKERYFEQVKRVFYVLDKALKGKTWLVGDKCTIADLSFVTWDGMAAKMGIEKNYPDYYAWNQRLVARPSVQKMLKDKEAAMAAGH